MNKTLPRPLVGSHDELQALRALLGRAGFNERLLCSRLSLSSLDDDSRVRARIQRLIPTDPLGVLGRLLIAGVAVSSTDVEGVFSPDEIAALGATSLVRRTDEESGPVYRATARLVPVAVGTENYWIAADFIGEPGLADPPPVDVVFSGHNPLTRQFVRVLPRSVAGEVLELCSGTAVGALACAPAASRVVAVDIAQRSTDFATFNAWLNAASRIVPLTGDLYAPVAGTTFDWVIAHPPYVPTNRETAIYRDGGALGEDIVQRIVEGVPEHLRPGGRFYILTLGMDRKDEAFEDRVRRWLGPARDCFDLVFAVGDTMPVEAYARLLVERVADSKPEDLARWVDRFERDGVHRVVYGALVGRRFDPSAGAAESRRVGLPHAAHTVSFEWLLDWFDWLRRPDRFARLMASRPQLSPHCDVHVRYRMHEGVLSPDQFRLTNPDAPFTTDMRTDGWVVSLLGSFDGRRTVQDIFEAAECKVWPDGFTAEHLADLVCVFAERRHVSLEFVLEKPVATAEQAV